MLAFIGILVGAYLIGDHVGWTINWLMGRAD